jgi:DNA-binding NarL/FixJ family response regulator
VTGLPADRAVSPRLIEVIRYAANGRSNADIARLLYLAEDSVKTRFQRAYKVLGARDRSHAVAICLVRGLIHPHDIELPRPDQP